MSEYIDHYQDVHAGRTDWSRDGSIDALAKSGIPFEDFLRRLVNYRTPCHRHYQEFVEKHWKAREGGRKLPVSAVWRLLLEPGDGGNMAANDHALTFLKADRTRVVIGRAESECRSQRNDWPDGFVNEGAWPYGITLLSRKGYHKNLFFIKHNVALTSAFCVDCRWLVGGVSAGKIERIATEDSLSKSGIVTNDKKYTIPWDVVRREEYGPNNRGGHVCIVRNSEWWMMWSFIADRLGLADAAGVIHWDRLNEAKP